RLGGIETQNQLGSVERVPVIRLDSLEELSPARRIVFKMDIEGAEVRALTGLKDALAHKDTVVGIVELSQKNLRAAGTSAEELWGLLREIGRVALFDRFYSLIDCSSFSWRDVVNLSESSRITSLHGADVVL